MGKKIIGVIAFAAIAVTAGWNYQQNIDKVELSDLALENVEALASGEWGQGGICYQDVQYDHVFPNDFILYCGGCQLLYATSWNNESFCL